MFLFSMLKINSAVSTIIAKNQWVDLDVQIGVCMTHLKSVVWQMAQSFYDNG